MKKELKIILLPLLLLVMISNLNAKWWIFGQNEASVNLNYLYINSLSFDETDKELIFSYETLEDGMMHIRGKAYAGRSSIGRVSITINNQKTWQKAELSNDGSFDFAFKTEIASTYGIFVKIIDTTGKTNDIEETHKIISITDKDMSEIVMQTLDKLKDAYENESYPSFMKYVNEEFTGDYAALEMALIKDFTLFNNIQINFTINSLAYQSGKYLVSVTYNRTLESSRDGNVYSDSGITEFNFKNGKFGAMLYSMKNPIIFGLSEAEEISNGSVLSAQNDEVITVDNGGKVKIKSISEIANGEDGLEGGVTSLSANGVGSGVSREYDGFIFLTESTVAFGIGDINPSGEPFFDVANGACIQYVRNYGTIHDVTTLPSDGGLSCAIGIPAMIGDILEVKLPSGVYILFEVQSQNTNATVIEWKYF